jgi:tripartite-type tricarboxylate transporter receptor subunit TctC
MAPAGTPRLIIDKLYHEIARGLRSPELKERMVSEGMEIIASTPDEFSAYIKSETDKWSRVIKAAGIKPQ